ncbi:hypothetical protein D3C84_1254250 [compost metagenome]
MALPEQSRFVEGVTYPAVLNGAYSAFHVVQIDAKLNEVLIVWANDGTEEWAYLNDMNRWLEGVE